MPQGVFITGATSGIGEALAEEFASKGTFSLALAGRRIDRLKELKERIEAKHKGVQVEIAQLDVAKVEDVYQVLNELATRLGGLSVVIANAGVSSRGRVGGGLEAFKSHKECVEINLIGAMATVDAAVEYFRKAGGGHVVGMSSTTAFRGMPFISAYSATKAALDNYLEAARLENRGTSIRFTTFNPGFIETEMTSVVKKKPYVISSERCAQLMFREIQKGTVKTVIPWWPWILFAWFAAWLPDRFLAVFGPRNTKKQ